MDVYVNGDKTSLADGATVAVLLEGLGVSRARRIAVEVNEEIVPRSEFDGQRLRDGDRVEIVQAIGGG
jgi:sulfur carrier protein